MRSSPSDECRGFRRQRRKGTAMSRPVLLDLFCCEGGAAKGYTDAGFDVYGVDIDSQPRYPYWFGRGDALVVLNELLKGGFINFFRRGTNFATALWKSDIAAIHASPPCQAHTNAQKIQGNEHPELIDGVRELLDETGKPYVIENVPGSPLKDPVELCGAMFGLETYRHRLFEMNWPLTVPEHPEHVARTTKMGRPPREGEFMHVVGNFSGVKRGREVMQMPWASRDGLREAVPPAYTDFIGRQLLTEVTA